MTIRLLLSFILLVGYGFTNAQQKSLLKSITNSGVKQIYRLTDEQAHLVYKKGPERIDNSFFRNLLTTVPLDSNVNYHLPTGHFLKVYTDQNELKSEAFSIVDFNIEVGNNQSDLFIQLWRDGAQIADAQLKIKGRKIKYNDKLQGYWKRKTNKSGLLEITLDSKKWYFDLDKDLKNSRSKRISKKILYGTPLKHVITPIIFTLELPVHGVKSITSGYTYGNISRIRNFGRRTYEKLVCLFDYSYCHDYEYKFKGYALTNQPKYRKRDTVKFKALVLGKKGKPRGRKPLNVYLIKSWNNYRLIDEISPYRKGGYNYDLVLNDSLELRLDRQYSIAIGKSEDKILKRSRFDVEDYELKSIKMNLRTSGTTVFKDSTFSIYAEAKDENDLTLPDGNIELHALTKTVQKAYETNVFVPDTLWTHQMQLKPVGETEILLPDSILPNAHMEFELLAEVRNSENEYVSERKRLTHFRKKELKASLVEDSIRFDYLVNGKSTPKEGLFAIDVDTLQSVSFPLQLKLNQLTSYYSAFIDDKWHYLSGLNFEPTVEVQTVRNTDSLVIRVNNPSKLNFTYFIYKTNRLVKKGYSSALHHTIKNPGRGKYYFHIQYTWKENIVTNDYEINSEQKRIILSTDIPKKAYPGMATEVTVMATDEKGKPISDADLTAFAITKKFNYTPPTLDNFTKQSKKYRHLINRFRINEIELEQESELDYHFWKNRIGLDSIEFYHFLFPKDEYYQHSTISNDSSTTLAPFVVKNGKIQNSKIVYVDREPIYFAWNTLTDPYTFRLDSGYHQIKIRLDRAEIVLDSVFITHGVKNIISVPLASNERVRVTELSPQLSKEEQNRLYRYVMPYRRIDSNTGTFAYLRQGKRIFQLAPNTNYYQNLTGPIKPRPAYLQILNGYGLPVDYEPNFEYDFSPKLIKMRSFEDYPKWLNRISSPQSLYDTPLTYEILDRMKRNYEEKMRRSSRAYSNPKSTLKGKSTLHLAAKKEATTANIINTLLFKSDDAYFVRIYGGIETRFHNLKSGLYKVIFFNSNRSYVAYDSLKVKKGGQHFHIIDKSYPHPEDDFSNTIDSILSKISTQSRIYKTQRRRINEFYRERYSYSGVGKFYSGLVTSADDGSPLPGVNVIIKGTTYGTVTDINGQYNLYGPSNATLVFSFIGMMSDEVISGARSQLDMQLSSDVQELSEVVVVGYGATHRKSLTASISNVTALQGRAAGVQITSLNRVVGATGSIVVRGANSVNAESNPLIIVDGVPFEGELDQGMIISMELLKDAAATAIYGSRGANGVILITTKGFKTLNNSIVEESSALPQQNSIRSDFKDYALWEPQLKTNENGEATFKLKLPDDITNWETHIFAYGKGKRSGQLKVNTSSYLPLSGRLALPRFLIPGDSAFVVGKASNYTGIEQQLKYSFFKNNEALKEGSGIVDNVLSDSVLITHFLPNDTIDVTYTIETENGFKDGEQREIPVFEKGITTFKGHFWSLDQDTTITITFPDSLGTIKLYATADLKNIFLDEIDYLIDYKYECNEQLASRLIALATLADISDGLNTTQVKKAKQIIRKLKSRQNSDGFWGWWSEAYFEPWVTEHVVYALKLIEPYVEEKLNYDLTIDNAIWELEKTGSSNNKLELISIIRALNPTYDLSFNIEAVRATWESLSVLDKFTYWQLQQKNGIAINKDSIMRYAEKDAYGNLYFKNKKDLKAEFYKGNTFITLKAYEILNQMGEAALTRKIVNYFLHERAGLHWRNTYESSKVISTLKQEIQDLENSEASLKFRGLINETVSAFPFEKEVENEGDLVIEKTGRAPIYLTAYQELHVESPEPYTDNFVIKTSFDSRDSIKLVAGEVLNLEVKLTAKTEAEYLAIDIPIPASCSYGKKQKPYNETHREYYRDKVSIFFKRLKKGEHSFTIELIPRYNGSYTQNPTMAHWMYFPTIQGWNESKRIVVSYSD